MRKLALLGMVIAAVALVPAAATATTQGCPGVGGEWSATGPFGVTVEPGGRRHTIYRPTELGSQGCAEHPVVLWGNGTFASPQNYDGLLRHLASHGFIVVAANTPWAGDGKQMLAGLDYVAGQAAAPGSPLEGLVDLDQVGASGHSQGGGGASKVGADPRVDTTVPIEGAPFGKVEELQGPSFFMGGQNDFIVHPGLLIKNRYQKTNHVVAIYGVIAGAHHLTPLGDGRTFRAPLTAWLRFWLMGDEQARGEFFGVSCGYCGSALFSEFQRNALAQAIPGP